MAAFSPPTTRNGRVRADVRPLIGGYHAVVVRGRGLVVDGHGGRTFNQWYTQVVGQLSQPYMYAGAGVSGYVLGLSARLRDCFLTRG
jgi:hypothetical protein